MVPSHVLKPIAVSSKSGMVQLELHFGSSKFARGCIVYPKLHSLPEAAYMPLEAMAGMSVAVGPPGISELRRVGIAGKVIADGWMPQLFETRWSSAWDASVQHCC